MSLIHRSIVKLLSIVVSVRKSERQTFDGFAFVTACYNFHLTILPRRPTDTLFHRYMKHLHTHLAARNTLTREISRPIRTILVLRQFRHLDLVKSIKLEGNCKISSLDSNPTAQRLQASFVYSQNTQRVPLRIPEKF